MTPFSRPARPTAGTSPGGDNPTRRRPALPVSVSLLALAAGLPRYLYLPRGQLAAGIDLSFPLHTEGNAR